MGRIAMVFGTLLLLAASPAQAAWVISYSASGSGLSQVIDSNRNSVYTRSTGSFSSGDIDYAPMRIGESIYVGIQSPQTQYSGTITYLGPTTGFIGSNFSYFTESSTCRFGQPGCTSSSFTASTFDVRFVRATGGDPWAIVPEPLTWMQTILGFAAMAFMARRWQKSASVSRLSYSA
jgi:hypothetical protein